MTPALANNPLKSLLHLVLLTSVLPKLWIEPHPLHNPCLPSDKRNRSSKANTGLCTNFYPGTPRAIGLSNRKATWHDIESLSPDLPLVWSGSTSAKDRRPFITFHGQKIAPALLLYAWSIPLDSYLENTRLSRISPTTQFQMVNPFLYKAEPRQVAHKLAIFRSVTPYDPDLHFNEKVGNIPLSIIYDDVLGVFEEEDWDYPSEEFWRSLANYPSEGVERVLLYFRDSPDFGSRLARHLEHDSNSEFRKLII